ncbi:ATP-grasp domain-containing protein [Mariniblastus fucicola]|uniref:Glutathione synthetase n=1 Tax=Mariniblastus fucicola TaxID=980251 RepID=A0A5B9P2G5_9BACT|nr:hypothetical protein [Mariniblastus fucicola]QEG20394.1 Glutathione synthetase [Mariniblastus fucicola]
MKPILFLLNDRWSVKKGGTNATLMAACQRKGHDVYVTDVVHLQALNASELFAEAILLPKLQDVKSSKTLSTRLSKCKSNRLHLGSVEAVFIRTSPGKDNTRSWAHRLALEVMRLASDNGVNIVNHPQGLQKATSKLYTVCLPPEFVPRTLVCHSLNSVQAFAKELAGPMVIKPLIGSQGRDVFFIDGPESLNTRQVVDILGRTGYLIVQEFLPDASDGDIRVLTLDDSLVGAGRPIGIRRTPAAGEMRSNISLGGTAAVVELSQRQAELCKRIASLLQQDGIRFSGLDLIGEKIVEVNVFSPSGLQELENYLGADAPAEVIETLLNGIN